MSSDCKIRTIAKKKKNPNSSSLENKINNTKSKNKNVKIKKSKKKIEKIKYQDLDMKIRTTKKSQINLIKLLAKMKEPGYRVATSTMWLLNGLNKNDLQKVIPKFSPVQLERICKLLMDNIEKVNKICQDQLLQKHFGHHEQYNKFALHLIKKGRAIFYAFLENPKLYYTPLLSIQKGAKHIPKIEESILFMDEIDKWVSQSLNVN